jgi:hypothetical protein
MAHATIVVLLEYVVKTVRSATMGWYIEYLLLHSDEIKATEDVDSDQFNDLLTVEKAIKTFVCKSLFADREYEVLILMMRFRSFNYVSDLTGIERRIIVKTFRSVVYRLSVVLGGIFTDEGYLDYLKNKYKLTDTQIDKASKYMKSEFRHDILTKAYEEK